MIDEYKNLCERLQQYRIHYPLTQRELAEKSGVSVRSISRFENGEDISLSNYMKLLRAMDLEERMVEMIPDQTKRPSYYLEKETKRSRASGTRDNKGSAPFVWGDEK
ncbi:MAG: helix-turn-helix transcriptional regulator [Clostridiales bacterium]|nr:helix-turn-helix transcriptional regulator [Clostridiales bacterium]